MIIKKCLIDGCERKHKTKGMCIIHYMNEYYKINYYGRNINREIKVKDLRKDIKNV